MEFNPCQCRALCHEKLMFFSTRPNSSCWKANGSPSVACVLQPLSSKGCANASGRSARSCCFMVFVLWNFGFLRAVPVLAPRAWFFSFLCFQVQIYLGGVSHPRMSPDAARMASEWSLALQLNFVASNEKTVHVILPRTKATDVVAMLRNEEIVHWIEEILPKRSQNWMPARSIQAGNNSPNPTKLWSKGLTGSGQVLH